MQTIQAFCSVSKSFLIFPVISMYIYKSYERLGFRDVTQKILTSYILYHFLVTVEILSNQTVAGGQEDTLLHKTREYSMPGTL